MAMILASSERVRLRVSRPHDLDFVMETESHPDNRDYISQWTREQHRDAQESTDTVHLIIEADLKPAGYLIISGLENPAGSIELKRIVINDKGKGYGRDVLRLVKRCAFNRWEAHRLWLDVRSNNPRARQLYEEEGFVPEGMLRDCIKINGEYLSVNILSMLKSEFKDVI